MSSNNGNNLTNSITPTSFSLFGINPNYLNQTLDNDYLYLEESNKPTRGQFEYSFNRIGFAFMTGGVIGGGLGLYNGLINSKRDLARQMIQSKADQTAAGAAGNAAKQAAQSTSAGASWAVRRSYLLNYISKTGSNTANTFGIISLTYSLYSVILAQFNDQEEMNTLAAGTLTGISYRLISKPKPQFDVNGLIIRQALTAQLRMKRAAVGGLAGLLAGAFIVAFTTNNSLLNTPSAYYKH